MITLTITPEELDILITSLRTSEAYYDQAVAADEANYYARSLAITKDLIIRLTECPSRQNNETER